MSKDLGAIPVAQDPDGFDLYLCVKCGERKLGTMFARGQIAGYARPTCTRCQVERARDKKPKNVPPAKETFAGPRGGLIWDARVRRMRAARS